MTDAGDFKGLDKSSRKQKIIDTAATLFHRKGYASTSLDDVASELGISKAALYHYVSSKDRLLSIIYTQAFENIFRDTNEIWGMDLPPDEKLRRILSNHIKNIIIKNLSMFSVFFSEESQLPAKDFRKIREEKKKYTKIIEEIFAEGVSRGLFKDRDPRLQTYAVLGMCNWVFKWYRPGRTAYAPEEIADHFIGLLETGYMKDEGLSEPRVLKGRGKNRSEGGKSGKRALYSELKRRCAALTELVEKLEEEVGS
jgi:AcrR family transcriptional regulator